jgi:hypothetical protein
MTPQVAEEIKNVYEMLQDEARRIRKELKYEMD